LFELMSRDVLKTGKAAAEDLTRLLKALLA